ncbi:Uncharacterised protein [Mycobacteroides abscessus subsp. massiliense]|nr:Uncharacterised protein [Mycobacteroides abscessus subsp. massiliense]
MGKQYAENIVGEVLLLGIDQEGLLGKAVPAMSEPRCGLKGNPCLAPHAELESGGQDGGQKENAQCAFVLETGTPKP